MSSRFELSLLRVYEVLEYYSLTALLVYPPFQPLDVSFDELRLRSVAAPLMVTLRSSNSSQRLIAPLVRFGTFSSYRGANHSAACMMATVKIASMSSTLLQLVGGGRSQVLSNLWGNPPVDECQSSASAGRWTAWILSSQNGCVQNDHASLRGLRQCYGLRCVTTTFAGTRGCLAIVFGLFLS